MSRAVVFRLLSYSEVYLYQWKVFLFVCLLLLLFCFILFCFQLFVCLFLSGGEKYSCTKPIVSFTQHVSYRKCWNWMVFLRWRLSDFCFWGFHHFHFKFWCFVFGLQNAVKYLPVLTHCASKVLSSPCRVFDKPIQIGKIINGKKNTVFVHRIIYFG